MSACISYVSEYEWVDRVGHKNYALTKLLVNPHAADQAQSDLMISTYTPPAYALEHVYQDRYENLVFLIAGATAEPESYTDYGSHFVEAAKHTRDHNDDVGTPE